MSDQSTKQLARTVHFISLLWLSTVGEVLLRGFGDGTLGNIYNAFVFCIPPVYRSHLTPLKLAHFLRKSVGKTSSDITSYRTSEGMVYKLLYRTNSGCYNPWPNKSAFREFYTDLCDSQRANYLLDRAYKLSKG